MSLNTQTPASLDMENIILSPPKTITNSNGVTYKKISIGYKNQDGTVGSLITHTDQEMSDVYNHLAKNVRNFF